MAGSESSSSNQDGITAIEHALATERHSRERFEFLIRLSDALANATTLDELMRNATGVAVPDLGDWCSIFVLPEPTSAIPIVEVAHVDPERIEFAKKLQARFPFNADAAFGAAAVMRDGRPATYNDVPTEAFSLVARDRDELEAMREINPRHIMIVPLISARRVVGAMQFAATTVGHPYEPDDLVMAEAAAGRVATAIENIWLLEKQRTIATTLQRSLLPATLPAIPGIELAVRYWAAGEGTEVGGDFYDVFTIDDGHWGVVIGDVCGTGPNAAALTALARHTIRAAATHGNDPAAALRWLNDAIRRGTTDMFSTASVGVLAADGTSASITFAHGGHPLPVLVRNGTATVIGRPGSLLGLFDEIEVGTTRATLEPGDTIVMYTDGVTDVPPPHDLTDTALRALVARAADKTSAEGVASALGQALARRLPMPDRHDDIALLVMRVREPQT